MRNLSNHLASYQLYHDKLGNTLKTVVNHYNKSSDEFGKIDKDISRISSGKIKLNIENNDIEKPNLKD